jgi:Mpv17 / PMP22 family
MLSVRHHDDRFHTFSLSCKSIKQAVVYSHRTSSCHYPSTFTHYSHQDDTKVNHRPTDILWSDLIIESSNPSITTMRIMRNPKFTILQSLLLIVFSCTAQSLEVRRPLFQPPSPILSTSSQYVATTIQTTQQEVWQHPQTQNVIDVIRGGHTKAQSFLKNHPFAAAVTITTCNAVVADLMTQLVLESSSAPYKLSRTLLFAAFGFLYQGVVQYTLVNNVWEKLFPGTSTQNVIKKICAMNLISDPFLFLPVFYVFKQFLADGGNLSWSVVKTAIATYKANALVDLRNSWMVWFPGHAVTYGVMPSHKRIPWMAFLSLFYMMVLSLTRGG